MGILSKSVTVTVSRRGGFHLVGQIRENVARSGRAARTPITAIQPGRLSRAYNEGIILKDVDCQPAETVQTRTTGFDPLRSVTVTAYMAEYTSSVSPKQRSPEDTPTTTTTTATSDSKSTFHPVFTGNSK
ncbi:hypothetical protein K0M31_000640 [Melipona bicolor]|uniref:Uncharacterized protein n=1 Tax=Melipona bicolor TaxID=60889 RepID=A0AA40KWX3_9HYME|nr:hypothetical protein K0M31_000640 [Melipona bicolor]